MSSALPFDALTLSIDGTNLIEASAGTGKTYGIAALFTRLIVLEKKDIEKILVVTFTKAATAELKTRLRARLDEVLQVLNEIQTLGGEPEHISDGLNKYYEKEKKSPDDFLNRRPLPQQRPIACHRTKPVPQRYPLQNLLRPALLLTPRKQTRPRLPAPRRQSRRRQRPLARD